MTEITPNVLRRVRNYSRATFWLLGGVFLVTMAFTTESFTGVGHHLMLVGGGIAFGIAGSHAWRHRND